MVTSSELSRLKSQRPFKPFRVTTIDHEIYEVRDPRLILVGDEEVTIGLPHATKPPPVADDMVWLWMDSIEHVEMISTQAKDEQ